MCACEGRQLPWLIEHSMYLWSTSICFSEGTVQGGGISQWGPLPCPASRKEILLEQCRQGLTSWGETPHMLGGEHCWTQTIQKSPELVRIIYSQMCWTSQQERWVEQKLWGKQKQFSDGSCSDYKVVECKFPRDESQQQHHQPALHESKVQLVQGTDTRIPWEAAFQDKGLWHSWLVFQDSFLKLKTGPFQFTGKRATVSGCSGNLWLSPNKKRKRSKGEDTVKQSRENTEEQHIWRMGKVKSCQKLKLKLSLYLESPIILTDFFPQTSQSCPAQRLGRKVGK